MLISATSPGASSERPARPFWGAPSPTAPGSGTGVAEGPVVLWTNNGGTGEVSTRFNPEKPWKNHGFKGGNLPKMMMKYLDGKKLWGTENHEKHMIATPGTIFRT